MPEKFALDSTSVRLCPGQPEERTSRGYPGDFCPMVFHSILFERPEDSMATEEVEVPAFFVDLNLDQIIDAIVAHKQEYKLKPFFYTALRDVEAIGYRYEIMRDLEHEVLFKNINAFAEKMQAMRRYLANATNFFYHYQKERMFLDAVSIYCDAVQNLAHDLSVADLKSRGLAAFRDYVVHYAESPQFTSLAAETITLLEDLHSIKYTLRLKEDSVQVRAYEGGSDYSIEVEAIFQKFKQGVVKDYRAKFSDDLSMNHVEAKILDFVAKLHPDVFGRLDDYCAKNAAYVDEKIKAFDREVQFYVAYLEYIARFRQAGLTFCYPHISQESKEVFNYEGFDVALADKLITENSPIVCNDFFLKGQERIFVISGPNQGGKTTFARTFGQLHYLASLGCPVPGKEARLFICDRIFTHFEKEERINNLRGKLQDDLIRIHDILEQATPNSIIIMNEIFTSTTLKDAVFLGKKIMQKIIQLDLLCVYVTFIVELASLSEKTVSMVSTVVPDNPALRTYKIVRRPADGLAQALSIAEKYRLTYDYLQERIKS
jgi:DNA mismatch repair protein MutS